jgi:Ala-tRNA(Pro) deacylase
MPLNKVRAFLDRHSHQVRGDHAFEGLYRAQRIAALAHIPGQELAKTVIVEARWRTGDGCAAALYRVGLLALKKAVGVDEAVLGTETEFKQNFPDCETGAMPPFGIFYGVPVYTDESLTRAGNHGQCRHAGRIDPHVVRGLRDAGEARGVGLLKPVQDGARPRSGAGSSEPQGEELGPARTSRIHPSVQPA